MDLGDGNMIISAVSLPGLVIGLSFATMVLLVGGIGYWFVDETPVIKRRLRAIQTGVAARGHEDHKEGAFFVRWAEPVGKLVLPGDNWKNSHTSERLVLAGYRSHKAVYVLAAVKVALVLTIPILISFVCLTMQYNPLRDVGGIALLLSSALTSFYLPDFLLSLQGRERQAKIRNDFPDAMDLLVVCVEAGLSLDAAIQRVGAELRISHPELGDELQLVSLEVKAGKTKAEALKSLADRTCLQEIKSLSSILIQAEHFGTSIAASITGHADEMRNVRIQTARERAAKLPVKMAFPVMFCIFPALFLILLGPAVIKIVEGFSVVFR